MGFYVFGKCVEVEFWFAGAIVGLDEHAASGAIADYAFEAGFETGAAAEDDDGGERGGEREAGVGGGVGSGDFEGGVGEGFHCSGREEGKSA